MEVIPELPSLTHAYYLSCGSWGARRKHGSACSRYILPAQTRQLRSLFWCARWIYRSHSTENNPYRSWWMGEWKKIFVNYAEAKITENSMPQKMSERYMPNLPGKGIKVDMGRSSARVGNWKEFQTWKSSAGYQYRIPGSSPDPEQVTQLIPKDILVFNWFWDDTGKRRQVSEFGFRQV